MVCRIARISRNTPTIGKIRRKVSNRTFLPGGCRAAREKRPASRSHSRRSRTPSRRACCCASCCWRGPCAQSARQSQGSVRMLGLESLLALGEFAAVERSENQPKTHATEDEDRRTARAKTARSRCPHGGMRNACEMTNSPPRAKGMANRQSKNCPSLAEAVSSRSLSRRSARRVRAGRWGNQGNRENAAIKQKAGRLGPALRTEKLVDR